MGFIDTGATYEPVQRRIRGPTMSWIPPTMAQLITVYNKSGDTFYQMTNPDGAERTYNGFQINVRKRFSHNWQTNTSYTWSRTRGNVNNNFGANAAGSSSTSDTGQTGVFANPNRAINSDGPMVFDYTHHFKAEGTYRIPYWGGFNISGIYRYITGAAWGRRAGIRGLDQGTETVRIEPRGTRRVDALNNFDFRVEKTFVFGQQSRTAGLYIDVFNVNNQGIRRFRDSRPMTDTSGSTSATRVPDRSQTRQTRCAVYVLTVESSMKFRAARAELPAAARVPAWHSLARCCSLALGQRLPDASRPPLAGLGRSHDHKGRAETIRGARRSGAARLSGRLLALARSAPARHRTRRWRSTSRDCNSSSTISRKTKCPASSPSGAGCTCASANLRIARSPTCQRRQEEACRVHGAPGRMVTCRWKSGSTTGRRLEAREIPRDHVRGREQDQPLRPAERRTQATPARPPAVRSSATRRCR